HTPEGTELVTRPEEIRHVRHEPYDGIWWHRNQWICKGSTSPPREILDIKACPKGSEDRCPKGLAPRDIWFILKRDSNWIYFSPDQRNDPYDWSVGIVIGQVAESTQFAAELFPYLLKLAGFSLGLSSRLAVILASEILSALGEQGVRAARGEKMQSALEVIKGIGFGAVTAHFMGRLFHESPGRTLEQNLEEATERAAARARVEVARTDASLVESELRAGRARAVDDPDLLADGYRFEVEVTSEGQKHFWRKNTNGSWCRFTDALCVGQLNNAVKDAEQHLPTIEGEAETKIEKGFDIPDVGLPGKLAAARRRILQNLRNFVKEDPALKKVKEIDPGARFGVQGSVVRGSVGNPRKLTYGRNFDPNNYDLDFFVISKELKELNVPKVVGLPQFRDRLYRRFPGVYDGLKQGGKGLSVKVYRPGETIPGPLLMLD
ncbi:MAG: hypothetical protein M3Z24_10125, partial [Chloroflexota bacterium]|nr:hypothetical protein [Chloroflexota bacterium]